MPNCKHFSEAEGGGMDVHGYRQNADAQIFLLDSM